PGVDVAGMRALARSISSAGSDIGVQYRRLPGAVAPALNGRWSGKAHQAALGHCQDLAGAMNVADGAFNEAASALTTFANTCESIERQLRDISGKLDSPPPEAVAIGRPGGLAGYDSTLRLQDA